MIYYSMEWGISNKILIKYPHIRSDSMWGLLLYTYVTIILFRVILPA